VYAELGALPALTLQELSVCELVGVGGAGTVERALWGERALDLKRPLQAPEGGRDGRLWAALAREGAHGALLGARADAGVAYPLLVARLVAGDGALEGLLFEAIEGVSALGELRQRARGGAPLTPREVGERVGGVCVALIALHSAGVTHGDLCLSNVLIRDEGSSPTLIDLGSAWSARHPYDPAACRARPRYTSPERAACERAASARSSAAPTPLWAHPERAWAQDAFSLGALWYAWVSGAPPDLCERPRALDLASLGWPPRWAEAVEALMAAAPESRPRIDEVGSAWTLWGG
jgi:hypothetical protein